MNARMTITAGLAGLMLGACSPLPPAPEMPRPVIPSAFVSVAQGARADTLPDPQWWRGFKDTQLDLLVELALDHNFDLAEARARIDAARAQISLAHADRAFQLSVDPQARRGKSSTRQSNPYAIQVPAGSGGAGLSDVSVRRNPYATNFLLPLEASYEVDLWGRLGATEQAAIRQGQVSAEDYSVARLALISNLVATYLQLRMQQAQLELLREEVALQDDLVNNARAGVSAGLTDASTLGPAIESAESIRRQFADMQKSLQLDGHALEVLCGQQPGALEYLHHDSAALPALPPTPADLPAAVLQSRPDVRRDEASLQAARFQTSAARADFFPQLKLTSTLGRESDALSSLLQPGSALWSLAAQLSYPLIDGGRVRAGYAQAQAQFEAAAQHYQGTVVQALREVEDALVTLDALREQQRSASIGAEAAASAARRQQQRQVVGLATQNDYATARLSELQQRSSELGLQAQALTAYVSLRKALGE